MLTQHNKRKDIPKCLFSLSLSLSRSIHIYTHTLLSSEPSPCMNSHIIMERPKEERLLWNILVFQVLVTSSSFKFFKHILIEKQRHISTDRHKSYQTIFTSSDTIIPSCGTGIYHTRFYVRTSLTKSYETVLPRLFSSPIRMFYLCSHHAEFAGSLCQRAHAQHLLPRLRNPSPCLVSLQQAECRYKRY